VTKYDIGNAFGHFGISVPNVQKTLDMIKKLGYKCPSAPAKERNDTYAYLEDPDGYKFKLIQRKSSREPFSQVSFRVADVDRSILYHQDAYGMKLLARIDYPSEKKTFAYVAYDMDETRSTVLEFEYNYGQTNYSKGTGYAQLAIGTEDVYKTTSACELIGGGKIVTAPGALPKINTKICAIIDPDGWKTVWVDNNDFAKELEPASFDYQVKCTTNNKKQQL
jgi:lactoylglutathione lyase